MAKDRRGRPKAEPPKGFRDTFGADVSERKAMLEAIAGVYHRYGFDPLETPAVETVEALGKFLPDTDRPNEGVFAWQEEDGDWLALRYDLTAPLARVAAQFRADLPTPYRRYAMGPVWRNEKPGPGRFREFYQCDADTVGAPSAAADAEMAAMLADVLEALGISRGDYVVRVNNRKVLEGALEVAGLRDPAEPDRYARERGVVMRAIDKLDRIGESGVRQLLGTGRTDPSGDFTSGANLTQDQIAIVMGILNATNPKMLHGSQEAQDNSLNEHGLISSNIMFSALKNYMGNSEVGLSGVRELETINDLITGQGWESDRIRIDTSVVRGLGYYTGPVFEAELTFEMTEASGASSPVGSVAGGGRYDDLVKRFTGQAVPATGVSIGVDRLLAALRARRADTEAYGPVVVTVMDRHRMATYQAMAGELRAAGIRAEVYLGNPKNFGNQLKYADRRAAPAAVIQGADEAAREMVQIKDLRLGAEIAATASVEDWKTHPAQREVPRAELVPEIRRVLDRTGG